MDVVVVAVNNGVVYASMNINGYTLNAFDAATGNLKWYTNYGGMSFVISKGLAFSNCYSNNIALSIWDANTGVLKTSYTVSGAVNYFEPVVYNGKVYIGIDNKLYCYSP